MLCAGEREGNRWRGPLPYAELVPPAHGLCEAQRSGCPTPRRNRAPVQSFTTACWKPPFSQKPPSHPPKTLSYLDPTAFCGQAPPGHEQEACFCGTRSLCESSAQTPPSPRPSPRGRPDAGRTGHHQAQRWGLSGEAPRRIGRAGAGAAFAQQLREVQRERGHAQGGRGGRRLSTGDFP